MIPMQQFAMVSFGGGVVVSLAAFSDSDTKADPLDASAGLSVLRAGEVRRYSNNTLASDWAAPKSATVGDAYWVRLTQSTGTAPTAGSAALNTWLQLSTDRAWFWNLSTVGTTSFTGTYAIATDSGGANIVASNSVTVTSEVI